MRKNKFWFLSLLTLAYFGQGRNRGAVGEIIFNKENNKRSPYNSKADQLMLAEWFFIKENADHKLYRRRNVLKQANHPERDRPRRRREHQQGDCGNKTRAN